MTPMAFVAQVSEHSVGATDARYLSIRAQIETATRDVSGNVLLFNYFLVPFIAGLIGFTVSSVTLKQFGPPKQ